VKSKKRLWIKLLIGLIGLSIIYFQFKERFTAKELFQTTQILKQEQAWPLIILALMLMPINWLTESIKWHYLIRFIAPYTFRQSFKATLAGVYFGNFLPYRLGDLGGRLAYLETKQVLQGTLLYTTGGIAQIYITLLAGLLPLLIALPQFTTYLSAPMIIILVCLLLVLFPFLLKILPWLFWQIKKISWLQKFSAPALFHLEFKSQIIVLMYSFLRYSIYISQFVILCKAFGLSDSLWLVYQKAALMFLLFAFVPSFFATDWVTRVGLALLIFGNSQAVEVSLAASVLWIINILFPSLLGYIIILTYKIKANTTFKE
jgi:hypothetical protein